MKKSLVQLMALGLFAAMPVLAAEHEGMMMETPDGARECALQAESIQQKIKRLNIEVAQGTKKHSVEDLKKLENQLKETNKLLDQMNKR